LSEDILLVDLWWGRGRVDGGGEEGERGTKHPLGRG
jgi:hypothetical protein